LGDIFYTAVNIDTSLLATKERADLGGEGSTLCGLDMGGDQRGASDADAGEAPHGGGCAAAGVAA